MTNEELAELIQKTDSKTAKAELWEQNKGIIYRLARSYYNPTSPHTLEDLVQQGYFALLYAVKSYDKAKGYKFTTYLKFSFKLAIRNIVNAEIYISLDAPLRYDGEEKESSIADTIPDNSTLEELERALNLTAERQAIYNALERLRERERNIILDYYFNVCTLSQIASKYNVCAQRISELHRRALRELRKDPELMELYQDTIKDKQLKSLSKSAERPDRVESRHALEEIERKQKRKEREIDFLNTLRAFVESAPQESPERIKYIEYLEQHKKYLQMLEYIT